MISNAVVGNISGAIPLIIGWAAVEPAYSTGALALFLNYVCLAATAFLCSCDEAN